MGAHFNAAAIKFLKGLEKNNDREWFGARKEIYERELKAPMLEVVGEINHAMLDFAPDFVREPAKCVMRIYRDIRFSKNKKPYKTHVSAWWARQGMEKTSGGGYYVEMSSTVVTIAAGVYMPEKEQLLAIRRMLVERHEEYRSILASRKMKSLGIAPFDGLKMARGPKGFDAAGPAGELILQQQWGVSTHLPVETALDAGFVKTVVARLKACAPLVDLLNEPLIPKARKPMF